MVGRRSIQLRTSRAARAARLALAAVTLAAALMVLGASAEAGRAAPLAQATSSVPLEVAERWRQGTLDTPHQLQVPPGFRAAVVASGLESARFMVLGPGGDLYVSQHRAGKVSRIRDLDGDGVADEVLTFAEGLNLPHGLAFRDNWLYVGETDQVIRLADTNGDGVADLREVVVPDLPHGGGHFTRTIAFGPDGMLYVSIGSSCNNCLEDDPRRATIMQFAPDGSNGQLFAQGLRNSVGVAFHPVTGELWATDNGRDRLGDDYPPEEINIVRAGQHYGWPRCHGERQPDPELGDAGFCAGTEPPALAMQAHSAPLGLTFYDAEQFPPGYQGELFVAFHGSWNRSVPTGYKVVRVIVADGAPRAYEDFATGWDRPSVWGRPVDVLVGPDGSLLVSDDRAGAIYRIWYAGS